MPTKPIPYGTCNVSVNVPKATRRALGRMAYGRGQLLSEFLRDRMAESLSEAAGRVGELQGAAIDGLVAMGRCCRIAAVVALTAVCAVSEMERGSGRSSGRRPVEAALRVAAKSARKIGEWEAVA